MKNSASEAPSSPPERVVGRARVKRLEDWVASGGYQCDEAWVCRTLVGRYVLLRHGPTWVVYLGEKLLGAESSHGAAKWLAQVDFEEKVRSMLDEDGRARGGETQAGLRRALADLLALALEEKSAYLGDEGDQGG